MNNRYIALRGNTLEDIASFLNELPAESIISLIEFRGAQYRVLVDTNPAYIDFTMEVDSDEGLMHTEAKKGPSFA